MKKMVVLLVLAALAATACGKDKNGSSGNSYNGYNGGYNRGQGYGYNNNCPGFNGASANPYQLRNNQCIDVRSKRRVNDQYCLNNTFNTGWNSGYNNNPYNGGNGLNNPYNPACNNINGNQYQLNYFYSGSCSFLNRPDLGLVYREVVFPGTQTTQCVEYATYQQFTSFGNPMIMNQYPGAAVGCIPGVNVPPGCNCMGANAGFGLQAGIGVGPFGVSVGVGAGTGYQAAGICFPY